MQDIRNIAVVGGGIAGLSAAWLLSHRHRVTLYEANDYVGGHTNTVEVDTPTGSEGVDTGFVVFNDHNYPNLVALFDWLNVDSQATVMSFSVSAEQGRYEYAGTNLNTLFAQRARLLDRRHLRLLAEVVRFNRVAKRALARGLYEGGGARRVPGRRPLRHGLPAQLPAPDGCGDLVLPAGAHAGLPGPELLRVLP